MSARARALWMIGLLMLGVAMATAVTIGWDASVGATGYKLYYGLSSRSYDHVIDCGTNLSQSVTGLLAGRTYYFAVTAYNAGGESGYSSEITFVPRSLPPPSLAIQPPIVTLTLEGGLSVTGRWDMIGTTQGFFRGWVQ